MSSRRGARSGRRGVAYRGRRRAASHEDAMREEQAAPPPKVPDHPLVPAEAAPLIDDDDGIAELMTHARAAGSFAYDTEFIGELSYYPKLCVIQIATADRIALIDPLEDVDLTPVWEAIADPDVRTIVHAGFQDLEPVVRHLDRPPANVVDTQIAAGFAGQPFPSSLRKLVESLLGVRLGKALTFTQWDDRPLSKRHQRYAADDVRYLTALDAAIREQLETLGHVRWCQDECCALGDPDQYRFDPEAQYWRLRGADRLDARQLGALRALFILRDEIAREHDVPPRTLLKDDLLVTLSRTPPRSLDQLRQTRGLPRPLVEGAGQRLLDAIDRGREDPRPPRPKPPRDTDGNEHRTRIEGLYNVASAYCRARGIDPALVMTRTDAARLYHHLRRAGSADDLRTLQGWRGELLEEALMPFLRDGIAMSFRWSKERGVGLADASN